MAVRTFNNANINDIEIPICKFVNGSGEIHVIGKDIRRTTDDHLVHFLRTNIFCNCVFKLHGDFSFLNTNTRESVFGGMHIFYFDDTEVLRFRGTVSTEYNKYDRFTKVKIDGEAEDA